MEKAKQGISVRYMASIGFLAVLGLVSEMLNFPLPLTPPFLKFDFSSLPSLIGGIAMGPVAVIYTEFVKNALKLILNSQTVGIGELSNFICGVAFSLPAAIVYRRTPGNRGYITGAVFGVISLIIVGCASNYFLIIPAYAAAFGGMEKIIAMCAKVNPSITDLGGVILLGIAPFNLIKGGLTAAAGFLLYKRILPVLKK